LGCARVSERSDRSKIALLVRHCDWLGREGNRGKEDEGRGRKGRKQLSEDEAERGSEMVVDFDAAAAFG
jgi:hypothetical protein